MVTHRPWGRPLALLSVVLVGLVCLVVGYAIGDEQMVSGRLERQALVDQIASLGDQVSQLEARTIDMQLTADVQRSATDALREELTGSYREISGLKEEVALYKGLMDPKSLSQGLQIAGLELSQLSSEGVYRYELLLTQVALRRSYISGDMRLEVSGRFDSEGADGEAVLSLTELNPAVAYPVKFKFRYFQDLSGQLRLPDGFQPVRVLVTASQKGKQPLTATFPWSVDGAEVDVQLSGVTRQSSG